MVGVPGNGIYRRGSVLFVFLDGVGIGAVDRAANPFAQSGLPGFAEVSGTASWTEADFDEIAAPDVTRRRLDACLGVPGLPQSGTGQATLFTGINCAAIAGRHYGPYPHSATRIVLRESNLFRQALSVDVPVAFANAYPPVFFEYAQKTDRWPVTTRCCLDAGVEIRVSSQISDGTAVPADLTGDGLVRRDPAVEPISESRSASILLSLTEEHAVVVLEYFLTDKAGHSMDPQRASEVLGSLDRFFLALHQRIDYDRVTLVVTSDHGNLEDLSTRTHTRNPVPLVARGAGARHFREAIDLCGVTPAIVACLGSA